MPADKAAAKNDGAFSLKRLDSFHLNQLTAKVFESPQKICLSGKRASGQLNGSSFNLNQGSASPSPKFAVSSFFGNQSSPSKFSENSPVRICKRANVLDKISEKDSFCTDASMVSFCSDDLSRSKKKRGEKVLEKFGLVEDILEEDSDDESLICHLHKLAGDQSDTEELQLEGSPIKRNLRNPGLSINKIITKAKREAKEVLMAARNDPTKPSTENTSKCMFTLH